MTMTRSKRTTRIAAIALAAVALALSVAPAVGAAGLRNCVDVTGPAAGNVGCYELVWVDGVQYRMTFFGGEKSLAGAVPAERLGNFYVIGPQTDEPQSQTAPFVHDHVVAAAPRQNGGEYIPLYRGILVLCSEQGIVSGACVPTFSPLPGGGVIPLATTVNGQMLTSAEAVEAAADAGLVVLFDTGSVIVGAISGR
jgi:hypothetical protein